MMKQHDTASTLASKYKAVRAKTRTLFECLSAEDQMLQSCPEACPVKWHQAHTTWFFETFVLRPFLLDYEPFHEHFHRLFNTYYLSLGEAVPAKNPRMTFSRPTLEEIVKFRAHVDAEMERLLSSGIAQEAFRLIGLGLNHEQQHQELALTGIKHAFFVNPMQPSYDPVALSEQRTYPLPGMRWIGMEGGLTEIGYSSNPEDCLDFCFDNETPRHRIFLDPFQIASRLVTCREYLEFMLDDGYLRSSLWLCDGNEKSKAAGWEAPLYWERDSGDELGWRIFTLRGWSGLSSLIDTAVCHVSFFEADAFARWRGCRLPTEAEWETASRVLPLQGNLLDAGGLHPAMAKSDGLEQMFGDCWEWTASPFAAYPGHKPFPGAVIEYTGKFTSGQMILRGGSCLTPADHVRATYRNFFPPATRLQCSGIRLAMD